MRLITISIVFFISNICFSQEIMEDWKKFSNISNWNIKFKINDSINQKRPFIGELIFSNKKKIGKEDFLNFSFKVFKKEMEFITEKTEINYNIFKKIYFHNKQNVLDKFFYKDYQYHLNFTNDLIFKQNFYDLTKEIETYIKI